MIDLQELKQLYEKTTQGEWEVSRHYLIMLPRKKNREFGRDHAAFPFRMVDAAFIAFVHNAMPELLELVERATPRCLSDVKELPFVYEKKRGIVGQCVCGKWVIQEYKHCPHCGQKLDWSENNEQH